MDLDDFDGVLSGPAKVAPTVSKFQPKGKPRPRKGPSAPNPSVTGKVTKEQHDAPTLTNSTPTQSVPQTEKLAASDAPSLGSIDESVYKEISFTAETANLGALESNPDAPALVSEITTSTHHEDGSSNIEKSAGENAEAFPSMEPLDGFIGQSATAAGTETENHDFSIIGHTEDRSVQPPLSSANDSPFKPCKAATAFDLSGTSFEHDLTNNEALMDQAFTGIHIEREQMESEGAEGFSFLDQVDIMCRDVTTSAGKYQPKPKARATKSPDRNEHLGPSNADLDDPSLVRPGDTFEEDPASECLMNEAPTEFVDEPQPDGGLSEDVHSRVDEEHRTETLHEADSSCRSEDGGLTSMTVETNEIGNEFLYNSDNEARENGGSSAEAPSELATGKDKNNDEDYRTEEPSRKQKSTRKSKKVANGTGTDKPPRKRKKAVEAAEQSKEKEKPPKKFPRATRRKRTVDKSLLEAPEETIDYQKLPIKDLLILADFKERQAKKDATAAKPSSANDRPNNGLSEDPEYDDGEALGSDLEGGSFDNPSSSGVKIDSNYYNYHSFMKKRATTRWSKQDTELFYQGVRQFGSDLSMIQQLFPHLNRHHIKLKYKKEERQHPLMLHDALTTRATDLSQFELVIGRLQEQINKEENSHESPKEDDVVHSTGVEEGSEATPETQVPSQEAAKSEQKGENEEADVQPEGVGSPAKSHDSDYDELWNYASEL